MLRALHFLHLSCNRFPPRLTALAGIRNQHDREAIDWAETQVRGKANNWADLSTDKPVSHGWRMAISTGTARPVIADCGIVMLGWESCLSLGLPRLVPVLGELSCTMAPGPAGPETRAIEKKGIRWVRLVDFLFLAAPTFRLDEFFGLVQ
jgi:hypothetical protein